MPRSRRASSSISTCGTPSTAAVSLHYQPILSVEHQTVIGFEALLRWQHPERGSISPAEFIPIAEDNRLIVGIGAWVLLRACREAASWPGDLRVSVNVSAIQFGEPGLEDSVVLALAASGLPASRLELEVTETVLLKDTVGVLACLHRLRGLGVSIALDDFGTGFSSLAYLRRFPFDKIKIDQSFVGEIEEPNTAAIVEATVDLGHKLGARITAEGVETEAQLEALRQRGCNEAQGYSVQPSARCRRTRSLPGPGPDPRRRVKQRRHWRGSGLIPSPRSPATGCLRAGRGGSDRPAARGRCRDGR